ncbi:MAG TPA: GTP cyclohydrolase FolE2 [Burkholderiaceae bacterium]|nr:GTP cyclohydrolase FolE2 [Burkholderiaceae bacterium]
MNARDTTYLPDVQSATDLRDIAIQRVGIKSIRHPVMVASATGPQPSVALVDMYVALPAEKKGTHMSRFIEVLAANRAPLTAATVNGLLQSMLTKLEADEGYLELRFPYFVRKTAPVSGVESLMDYEVTLSAERKHSATRLVQKVVAPVTSLCPCSKKVADYGAHNQRSHVTIAVELAEATAAAQSRELTLDEQIRIAEHAASSELWGLLKRSDEKYVTERAYDNPKFVEDMVRDVALVLNRDARVLAYAVESENFESIHNHSAYALIEHDKRRR